MTHVSNHVTYVQHEYQKDPQRSNRRIEMVYRKVKSSSEKAKTIRE